MSLLGNGGGGGDCDSSLTSNTGWGMMPPMNSGADWGNSSSSSTTLSSSSSSIGANNNNNNNNISGNNHNQQHSSSNNNNANMSTIGGTNNSGSSTTTNCWQNNSGQQQQSNRSLVSTSVSTTIATSTTINEQQALSSSPKLSSSWAQAAGKGLLASGSHHNHHQNQSSSSSNSSGINQNSHQTTNNNVINNQSSSSSLANNSNNHIGSSVSSGPNQTSVSSSSGTQNNQFSHDSSASSSSYSVAMLYNNGSNNNNSSSQNCTTGSNSAFQQQQAANNSSNNNHSSSNDNNINYNIGGKRAIATANIQEVIGNLSDEIRETLLTEKWRSPVINQDSPWNLPPSPQSSSPKDNSQWRCPVNSGTEIWEAVVKEKKSSNGSNGNGNGQPMANNHNGIQPNGSGVIHGGPQMNGPAPPINSGSSSANISIQPQWGQSGVPSIGGNWGDEEPDLTNHWVPNPIASGVGGGNGAASHSSINWSPTNGPILPGQNTNSSSAFDSGSNPGWNQTNETITTKSFDSTAKNVPRKPWGSFDNEQQQQQQQQPQQQSEQNWERIAPDNSFGTWNSDPSAGKKESGWEKESIDSQNRLMDDGTALWGSTVRQGKQPICNWKDTKFGGNNSISNNNNKNGSNNGWNKGTAMNVNPTNGSSIIGNTSNGGIVMGNNNHQMMQQQQQKPNQQMTNRSTPWSSSDTNQQQQRKSPLWNTTMETTAVIVDPSAKINGNQTSSSSSWLADSPSSSSLLWPTNDINNKPNNPKTGPGGGNGAGSISGLPPAAAVGSNWMDPSASIDTGHWSAQNSLLQNRIVGPSSGVCAGGNGGLINSQKLSREIYSSTHFKTLQTMGFKKDDIENALRNNQMRFEDALKELTDDMNRCALTNDNRNMRSNIFNAQQQAAAAIPGSGPGGNGGGNINQNTNTNNSNISSLPNRQMIDLIRLAINAGFLNAQILNQPMSQHNLEILNELLSQLKLLRTVQPSRDPASQNKMQQIKQMICTLQNQIQGHNSTQSTSPFMMMPPNNNSGGPRVLGMPSAAAAAPTPPNVTDFFTNKQNSIGNPNSNDLAFDSFVQNPSHVSGSKLGTWKNPYKQDDRSSNSNDFVRAPGPLAKQNSHILNSNNWAGFNAEEDTWGTDKSSNELAAPLSGIVDYDVTDSFSERFDGYYQTKPWKAGSKSTVDMDMTTVSLDSRSPNSLLNTFSQKDPFSWSSASSTPVGNANQKPGLLNTQTDSFGGAFSNPSQHSNTWAYNPPMPSSATQNMFGSGDKPVAQQMGGPQKKSGSWLNSNAPEYNLNSDSLWSNHVSDGDNHTAASGGQHNSNKPRPPPGLSGKMNQQNPGSTNSGNVWNSGLTTTNNPSSSSSGSSEYLRLRNLTAQIDGSTLKTLCLQHGPLSLFHMVLNHGVAIVRYSHRDQAFKAQSALNNCVLGNTTIIADFPTENEIQQYLTIGGVTTTATNNQLTNSLAASVATWSNGTNASHTVVTAGCGIPQQQQQIQSYQSNSVSAAAQQRGGGGVQTSSSSYGNNAAAASSSQTNHQNSLPYGAGGATHSSHSNPVNSLPFGHHHQHHHQNQYNGNSKLNAEHSIVGGGGWNTAPIVTGNPIMNRWNDMGNTGQSNSTLGLGPNGAAASLWSTGGGGGGFGGLTSNQSNDRQTPIQNFLPNDLLAGENN